MSRARAGDRSAWGVLVERHTHRVRVALLADGLGLDDSRELAQATWVLLWEKQLRGELERLELPGLAIAQARFLAMDLRRRRARELDRDDEELAPSPAPRVEAAQTLQRLEAALRERPALQQRIFRLAVDEQRPHAEIAHAVGLSLQRVRQILWEVRRALRATLDEPKPPRSAALSPREDPS
ncbi:MAG: RNA polymerase sigma factor [Myxococcota bacterium]